jgi:hypothetical protein
LVRQASRSRCHAAPVFSTEHNAGKRTSDAPCRAPGRPGDPDGLEEPEPLPPHPRQGERLSRLETPFLDRCSQGGRLRGDSERLGTRHRSRGFATDDSASDALSSSQRSRAERLDRRTFSLTLRPRAPRATRRLSTSAIDTFREHDHGPPNSARPLRQSPAEAATSREGDLSIDLGVADGDTPAPDREESAASREVTGQRPKPRALPLSASAPPIAIARGGSFAPTRSARTPPVARSLWHRLETPVSRRTTFWDALTSSPSMTRLRGNAYGSGPPPCGNDALLRAALRASPRRETRSAAPAVPSIAGPAPFGAPPSHPQPVPSRWSTRPTPFPIST